MLRSAKELQPSKVMFIKEIVEQGKQLIGFAVRLVGRAVIYDPTKDILVLEYQGFRLLVSTAFISSFDYRCGRLFQCIGEVSPCDLTDKLFHCASDVMISARILSCMDGLDCALYEEFVAFRREFEREYLSFSSETT